MNTKQPHIETLQMTIGVAMAEEDSPQNIEIPLEIKLPNGRTMYPACVLGGLPFHGQQQIAERIAAAWNAFTGIETTEIHAHAPSAGGMEPLRKRECLHQIAEPAPLDNSTAERALRRILHIVQRYLPPDGMSIDKAMNEIIAAVDPWPVADGDAGIYPPLPMSTAMHAADLETACWDSDQMRAYADATCAARGVATATYTPVALPAPVAAQSRFTDTPSDTWDSCSVEHARSFGGTGYEVRYLYTEQQVRALLATATGLPAQAARTWRGGNMTVADLVNNLLMMDQCLPIYGAQYIEHPAGRRRTIAVPPTVSIERVKDSRWIGEGEALNTAIIWTRAEQPAAPQVQAAAQDALEEAESVLNSINKEASHEVTVGDEVCYWQRKEWIDWAEKEVLPKVRAAIAAAQRAAAQKDE